MLTPDTFPGIEDFFVGTSVPTPPTALNVDITIRLRSQDGDPFAWVDFIKNGAVVSQTCIARDAIPECITNTIETLELLGEE